MKKVISIIILLFLSISGFSQELPTEKTEKHILIKGTNIFLIPPNTFEPSQNFKGFQNPNDPTSMIMAMEIPGPYNEVIKGFSGEMMKARGMDLISKQEVSIAGFEGLIIELNQATNGMVFSKRILIYGNEKASTFINGVYLKDSVNLGESIKASVLTTYVDTTLVTDPRSALDYALDENSGELKFHSVIGNGMLFNRDLKTPTESSDKVVLITDKSFAKMEILDNKAFCISRLKEYPDEYSVIDEKGINEIELDGLEGYELYASNNANETEEMYQVMLFEEDGGYFLFVGTYLAGNKKALEDIKRVIDTFERRK